MSRLPNMAECTAWIGLPVIQTPINAAVSRTMKIGTPISSNTTDRT